MHICMQYLKRNTDMCSLAHFVFVKGPFLQPSISPSQVCVMSSDTERLWDRCWINPYSWDTPTCVVDTYVNLVVMQTAPPP